MSSPVTFTLTRRRLAALVAALFVVPAVVAGGTAWAADSFSDVPSSHVFYDEIEWGAANGIVNGYPDDTFRPGNDVTRGASAAFLARYNDSLELVRIDTNPPVGTTWITRVTCPAGKRAIAGGGTMIGDDVYIAATQPQGAGAWDVRWESEDDAVIDPTSTVGWALCAPAVLDGP